MYGLKKTTMVLVAVALTGCGGGGSDGGSGGDPTGDYAGTETLRIDGMEQNGSLRMTVGGALGAQVRIVDGFGIEYLGSWNSGNFSASGFLGPDNCAKYTYTGTFSGNSQANGAVSGTRCGGDTVTGTFAMTRNGRQLIERVISIKAQE